MMELQFTSSVYEDGNRKTVCEQIQFIHNGEREEQLINLYPHIKYQKIEGFGGAITETAAYIYSLMDPQQKRELLSQYFSPNHMGYRMVRIPIDSCDFSLSHYEADGNPEDCDFKEFSFARVEEYILPMLHDAEAVFGGKLEIMLSPWSPPAYMKTNNDRNYGGKLKSIYWKKWAEYICRYIEEYRSRGYNVTMLTLQNEPHAVQTWDSCVFTAEEEKVFLKDYIWPSLVEHNLEDVEIYIWDHNKERALEWAETIVDDQTSEMIAGIAFHWYSGDHFEALQIIRERFKSKKIMLSEACIEFSKYSKVNNLVNAQKYAHDMIGDLNAGTNTFLDWNLVLDECGGPNHAENYCDAPFMYHRDEKKLVQRELECYMWHLSHFICHGAVRIGFSRYTDELEVSAFLVKDHIAIVILNRTNKTIPAYIRVKNKSARIVMQPNSIASGVIYFT